MLGGIDHVVLDEEALYDAMAIGPSSRRAVGPVSREWLDENVIGEWPLTATGGEKPRRGNDEPAAAANPIIFYNDDETINDHYQVKLDIDGSGVQDITEQIEAGLADVIEQNRC